MNQKYMILICYSRIGFTRAANTARVTCRAGSRGFTWVTLPGRKSGLSFLGHVLMEHRNGLVRDVRLTEAYGAERDAAQSMLAHLPGAKRKAVATDKAYDAADFVDDCRQLDVTPHVAQNTANRRSAIDGRTTRHAGYQTSLRVRAWVETHFGWLKGAAGVRQVKQRSRAQVEALFQLAMATSNLVRMRRLLIAGAS